MALLLCLRLTVAHRSRRVPQQVGEVRGVRGSIDVEACWSTKEVSDVFLEVVEQRIVAGGQDEVPVNRRSFEADRLRSLQRGLVKCFIVLEEDGEVKGGASASRRLDPHLARHQFGQLSTDEEAKTGATVLARRRLVHLREFTKELGHVSLCDANARVADGNVPPATNLRRRIRVRHRLVLQDQANLHLASLGELECVGNEVVQHLPQSQRVALDVDGHHGVAQEDELDALLRGSRCVRLHHKLDGLPQVERNALERDGTRLNLCHVQHVVGDREDNLTGPRDSLHQVHLVHRQRFAFQHFRL